MLVKVLDLLWSSFMAYMLVYLIDDIQVNLVWLVLFREMDQCFFAMLQWLQWVPELLQRVDKQLIKFCQVLSRETMFLLSLSPGRRNKSLWHHQKAFGCRHSLSWENLRTWMHVECVMGESWPVDEFSPHFSRSSDVLFYFYDVSSSWIFMDVLIWLYKHVLICFEVWMP